MFSYFLFRIKLLTPYSLAVYDVERRDKGMYQCLITNKESSAQAVAELKLGGKFKGMVQLKPIHTTFIYHKCRLIFMRIHTVKKKF